MFIEPEFLEKSFRKELRRQAEEFMEEADWYDDPAGYAADFALKMLRECDRLKDDLDALENVCFHCANADDYGDPVRHFHEPEGWHWHHYLDPGDGLPDPCANSELLERVLLTISCKPPMVKGLRKTEDENEAMNIFKAIADKTSWIYFEGPSKVRDDKHVLNLIIKLARDYRKKI